MLVRYEVKGVFKQSYSPFSGYTGFMVRGAFGYALRRLVCDDLKASCQACPLLTKCFYAYFFETSSAVKPDAKLALIRIGIASENIADAAAEIADAVLRGLEPHPILKMVMEEAEETIVRTCVGAGSKLEGRTIGDVALDDRIGMRIIAVRRRGKWFYSPSDSFKLKSGDVIIARGYTQGKDLLLDLAKGEKCEVA